MCSTCVHTRPELPAAHNKHLQSFVQLGTTQLWKCPAEHFLPSSAMPCGDALQYHNYISQQNDGIREIQFIIWWHCGVLLCQLQPSSTSSSFECNHVHVRHIAWMCHCFYQSWSRCRLPIFICFRFRNHYMDRQRTNRQLSYWLQLHHGVRTAYQRHAISHLSTNTYDTYIYIYVYDIHIYIHIYIIIYKYINIICIYIHASIYIYIYCVLLIRWSLLGSLSIYKQLL